MQYNIYSSSVLMVHIEKDLETLVLRCHQGVKKNSTFHARLQETQVIFINFSTGHTAVSLETKTILKKTVSRHNVLSFLNWNKTDKRFFFFFSK